LPARKAEAFETFHDNQREVNVRIFQGEDPDALNNVEIGEFLVEGLLDVPAGNVITLTLDLDLNGILHVSAREKASGKEKAITINNAISRFDSRELNSAKQRIHGLFGDTAGGEAGSVPESPALNAARNAIKKAEALFETVSAEDKEDMVDLIETISTCLENGDEAGLREPVERLNDIIYYLES
jgi:molecular chaperone DnaK (HSP70)